MAAFPANSHRSSIVPLFLGAGVAAFGLGLLGLAATMPRQTAPALPLPQHRAAQQSLPDETVPAATPTDWAPVFGIPVPEPQAPPEPEPVPEPDPGPEAEFDAPFVDIDAYRLQGLVVDGEDGGWAMVESDGGVAIYRVGEYLPGGERLIAIDDDGIEIAFDGEYYFIGFDDYEDYEETRDGYDPYDDDSMRGARIGIPGAPGSGIPVNRSLSDGPIMGPVGTGRIGR